MPTNNENNPSEKLYSFSNTLYIEMPLAIGLAVHICWACLLFTQIVMQIDNPSAGNRVDFIVFGVVFLVVFFATCFVAGFDREHITKVIRRKWAHFLVSACGIIGCIFFSAMPSFAPPISLVFSIIGALLAGTSCGFATVLWGEAARRRPFDKLAIITALAFILAFFAVLVIEYALTASVTTATLCISPFVSLVLVYKAQHDNVSYFKPQEFLVLPDGTKQVKEGAHWIETFHDLRISKLRFALKLGKSAFLFGIVFGSLAFENYRHLSSSTVLQESLLSSSIPLIAVLIFFVLFFKSVHPVDHPSTSKKLLPYFLVFLLFAHASNFSTIPNQENTSCIALLALLGTMLWFYPAELTHRYRISALLTFGYFAGFLALGVLVSAVCFFTLPNYHTYEIVPTLLCAAVFLLGFVFLIDDRQIRDIAVTAPSQKPRDDNSFGTAKKGTFIQRCQTVADTFLLSSRELEILIALSKGRNASYIQKELVISEGTVRTHMRNIYRKLGVHSQQELIDLVENMPLD